jgi:CubicO group peptidase (beta-lactamase class C family)
MSLKCSTLVLTLLLAGPAAQAGGQTPDAAALDSLIAKAVAEHHLIGVSVGVMAEGRLILAKGYGVRSLESGEPMTPQTMLRIGSVSKQFTCVAALRLAQSKRLSLSDPVARYFPRLTRAREITLRDLGGHLSGYRDYYPLDFVDRPMSRPREVDSIIAEFAGLPLDFEPRTRYSYSNTGFLILGRVIEKVTGLRYERFLERRVLLPLGLDHTRFDPSPEMELAGGYTAFALGAPEPAVPEGQGWLGAVGGLWSTPSDLLAWDLALMSGKVVSADSWQVMITPLRLRDGRSTGYSCGLGVRDRGPALVLSHGGAVSGFTAWNAMIPATRSGAVVLANMDFAATRTITDAILNSLMPPGSVPAVAAAAPAEVARALLEQLRNGTVDRPSLAPEYDAYLTAERVQSAGRAIAALGATGTIEVTDQWERGGLAVASLRIQLGATPVQALLYRRPDGTIEEFLPFWP